MLRERHPERLFDVEVGQHSERPPRGELIEPLGSARTEEGRRQPHECRHREDGDDAVPEAERPPAVREQALGCVVDVERHVSQDHRGDDGDDSEAQRLPPRSGHAADASRLGRLTVNHRREIVRPAERLSRGTNSAGAASPSGERPADDVAEEDENRQEDAGTHQARHEDARLVAPVTPEAHAGTPSGGRDAVSGSSASV